MALLSRTPRGPVLTLIGREDCPTCRTVKALLGQLDLARRAGIEWRFVDLAAPGKVQIDFPVTVVPTLHVQFPNGKAFMVNAVEMIEQWGLPMDEPKSVVVWLQNALRQSRAG